MKGTKRMVPVLVPGNPNPEVHSGGRQPATELEAEDLLLNGYGILGALVCGPGIAGTRGIVGIGIWAATFHYKPTM
jgi:hypothetical protein